MTIRHYVIQSRVAVCHMDFDICQNSLRHATGQTYRTHQSNQVGYSVPFIVKFMVWIATTFTDVEHNKLEPMLKA